MSKMMNKLSLRFQSKVKLTPARIVKPATVKKHVENNPIPRPNLNQADKM